MEASIVNDADETITVEDGGTLSIKAGEKVTFDVTAQSEIANRSTYRNPVWVIKKAYFLKNDNDLVASTNLNPSGCGLIDDKDCQAELFTKTQNLRPYKSMVITYSAKESLSLAVKSLGSWETKKSVTVNVERDVPIASLLDATHIPDLNLRACISELGAIMTSDVTDLSCVKEASQPFEEHVTNLAGIEYFYNLKNVDLTGAKHVFDAVRLYRLEALETLNITGMSSDGCFHQELVDQWFADNNPAVEVTISAKCNDIEPL
jgi:hypothetical protein